jgi:release factor glutamine methyltransferase
MIIQDAKKAANKILDKQKIPSSALDAEILLAFVLGKPKEYLLIHPKNKLTAKQFNKFKQLIGRRAKHEPVAYITGHKEFFGLDFLINKNVLIPRPETEILIEEANNYFKQLTTNDKRQINFIDIGTGSGCIAVSIAKTINHPKPPFTKGGEGGFCPLVKGGRGDFKIYATDISKAALKIAKLNARRHDVLGQINFLQGDLLKPLIKIHNSIIVANLPYLTTKEWQNSQPEIRKYEPRGALDGGLDGLKYFHELFQQLETYQPRKLKTIILEIGWNQATKIKNLAKKYLPGYKMEIKKDLAGFDRLVIIYK